MFNIEEKNIVISRFEGDYTVQEANYGAFIMRAKVQN